MYMFFQLRVSCVQVMVRDTGIEPVTPTMSTAFIVAK